MTKLQKRMLTKIARSPYTCMNGGMPFEASDTATWADTVIETAEDKGVFTSMLNEGLVEHSNSGKDSIVALTEKGFKEFQKLWEITE